MIWNLVEECKIKELEMMMKMRNKRRMMEELNREILSCERCRLHRSRKNAVLGEGNLDAKIMLVAQAPGEKEDKEGRMFIGPSGKILDELLNLAGLKREEIYMTNLVKCFLPEYRKPKEDEIQACHEFLDREIEIVEPEFIVPLGYYATKYIFQKYNLALPENFPEVYGKLVWSGEVKIYPLEHPSSLLYDNSKREIVEKHYKKLGVFKTHCKWMCCCPMVRFYKEGKLERKWIELYCKGDWKSCIRYQMEEKGIYHEDCMRQDGKIIDKLC